MRDPGGQAGDKPPGRGPGSPCDVLAAAYDACADGLYRYALMILADHAAAEDAIQQAFVKLARMGGRVLGVESCGDYLRTAVRNECRRTIETRRRRPESSGLAEVGPLIEPVSRARIDEDERLTVEAALRALPPEQREVVYLKVYEGMTFQQIADLLEMSINTVASRYRYAMDKLRERLAV